MRFVNDVFWGFIRLVIIQVHVSVFNFMQLWELEFYLLCFF